jgi:EpsI family protein
MMIRRYWLITALLLVACAVRWRLGDPLPAPYAGELGRFPVVLSGWTGQNVVLDDDVLSQLSLDDYVNRYYRSSAGTLGLYVAYYASQKEGDAVHSPLNCLPGSGWQPISTERMGVRGLTAGTTTINKIVVEKGLDRQLVLYWYQTRERVVASEYVSKAFLVKDAFQSGRTDIALVRIIAPIDGRAFDGSAEALALARPFAENVLTEIQRRLFQS